MHVPIGSSPTDDQKAAAKQLMALDDFTNKNRATRWLSDFLVQTLLHESTHAQAFTGVGKDLSELSAFPVLFWLLHKCASQSAKCLI